jgi:hypothetical protein
MHLLRYACDYSAERIAALAVDKAIREPVRELLWELLLT